MRACGGCCGWLEALRFDMCGGLGEYSGIDPTIIRLAFVFLTLFGGHGLLLYLIMCIVVPPEPNSSTSTQPAVPPAGPNPQ